MEIKQTILLGASVPIQLPSLPPGNPQEAQGYQNFMPVDTTVRQFESDPLQIIGLGRAQYGGGGRSMAYGIINWALDRGLKFEGSYRLASVGC